MCIRDRTYVDDDFKGRVMVVYDIMNNLGLAIGALLLGALLPAQGGYQVALLAIAVGYLGVLTIFSVRSRQFPQFTDSSDVN